LRRGRDGILAGVCSGLGEHFHLDPTLLRVIFVVLTLVPPAVGIILYLVLWFLMDPPLSSASGAASATAGHQLRRAADAIRRDFRDAFGRSQEQSTVPGDVTGSPYRRHSGRLWGGIVLIGVGAYLVLNNLGYLSGFRWDLLWPVLLIALGLLVLLRRR
jgi:phage shock protein PspC (stress-responsive transcriptional regulator)